MKFSISSKDLNSNARIGNIETYHGNIQTPIFMPVGTLGTVKGIHQHELSGDIGAKIILGNSYHLYLRPGLEVIKEAGGLHKFINWDKPILTDSGGYQVYSLASRRKISDEGVKFKSHIDGSLHMFSPEYVMEIQRNIGADIIMAFDECPPYPCEKQYMINSLERTNNWLVRCKEYLEKNKQLYGFPQSLFPIVQGGIYPDLRIKSLEFILQNQWDGIAIGGLSVGEPISDMYEITKLLCGELPWNKPRYLMGVGTPWNLLECIEVGVDMFDCVMPTRNGRNGMLFTWEGTINIKNKKWEKDFSPLDQYGKTLVDVLYSKAYLRHLFAAGEILGKQIASIHNLAFYLDLMNIARKKIKSNQYSEWKNEIVPKLKRRL